MVKKYACLPSHVMIFQECSFIYGDSQKITAAENGFIEEGLLSGRLCKSILKDEQL